MFLTYDILTVTSIIAIAVDLILGLLVFLNDRKNETNIIFGFLNIALSFYIAANFFSVVIIPHDQKLYWVRMSMFAAVFLDTFFYLFISSFPGKNLKIEKMEKVFIVILTVATAFITLTPWLFSDIIVPAGSVIANPVVEPGMILFLISAIYFIFGGVLKLTNKFLKEKNSLIRKQLRLTLIGTGVMFLSFISFNLLFTVIFEDAYFVSLTPLFTTVFVLFSSYAIFRLGMFNIKIIATELLVFSLWFFVLVRTVLSDSYEDQIMNGGLLFLIVVTGIFLIRSVIKEVDQKERLIESAKALKESHEREINKSKSEAKLRDEFVFVAAHELRTPITAIRGFLELVSDAEGSFPSDVQSDLDAIKMASEHLNELVNNLLEIARSDAGATKIETRPVETISVINRILAEVGSLVKEKEINLKTNNFNDGMKIIADEQKIKEVLMNLISNAVKYNRKGGEIEISILPEDEGFVIIEIRDNGFGIPIEQQEKIFGKFFRASNKDTQGIMGTGLGLFITKMLVEKMGGEITFSSVEGKGTTFAMSFPRA